MQKIRLLVIILVVTLFGGLVWQPVLADYLYDDKTQDPCPNYEKYFGDKAKYLCRTSNELSEVTFENAAESTGGPDIFGYTWDDTGTLDWEDITSTGTQLYPNPDDPDTGIDDEVFFININFSFNFYEFSYDKVYISSNGIIGFDVSLDTKSASVKNYPIPLDTYPQNFIAAFWDDLTIGGSYNNGKVYYQEGEDGGQKYLIVEFFEITRIGSSDLLTFEVILYDDGDFVLQYLDLNGYLESATVGIEDKDGVDGLQYLYNSSGLSSGKRIDFSRPSKFERVKIFPTYQSEATYKGYANFKVQIRNTGEVGNDTYNLVVNPIPPIWIGELYDEYGSNKLIDTNGDSVIDTGSIASGDTITVTVRIKAPSDAAIGDKGILTLTAYSSLDPNKHQSVQIDSFITASFSLAFAESTPGVNESPLGVNIELIWRNERQRTKVDNYYSGSSFGINRISQERFIYFWEKNGVNFIPPGTTYSFSNLEFVILNQFAIVTKDITKLTDHTGTNIQVYDTTPVFEATPNGKIGVAWVRYYIRSSDEKRNYNIFFAILDENGNVSSGPLNVTNNSEFTGGTDSDILVYREPRMTATDDNKFTITWVEKHTYTGGKVTTDIKNVVYSSDGSETKAPFYVTNFVPNDNGGVDYDNPTLTSMTGGKVFLVYYQFDSSTQTNQIMYSVFNSSGDKQSGPTLLTTGGGGRMDADQLSNGKVVLSWGEPTSGNIKYTVFNPDLSIAVSPRELVNLDQREAGSVSVTKDGLNHAVLTWMDSEWQQRLYYALVDGSGTVTSPEIIKYGSQSDSIIISSYLGEGNTTMSTFLQLKLPLVMR